MSRDGMDKVSPGHLQRNAYLYVRQSTLRQVAENRESTRRQYDLRQRAVALGWPGESIIVVDGDQGQSGATGDRDGFRRLVADVGMGRAGIVMSLEVSRLARSSSEWHRLLEICALSDTLILDEEGIYDPTHFNDRLLLGLKGTISEVEYWTIRSRLIGGMMNKARRGELRIRLPAGFVYDGQDRVVLDPDQRVQESIHELFRSFQRLGSAFATVRFFRKEGFEFPRRLHSGPRKGEMVWADLAYGRAVEVLHNPRYAGAFVYGRRSQQRSVGSAKPRVRKLPREQWHTLIPDAHEGYISWQEFEQNQKRIEANSLGACESRRSPPREGPALLQGLVLCGVCGKGMTVRYHHRRGALSANYVCRGADQEAGPVCQSIPGARIENAIGELLVEAMNPVGLEITLAVQEEVQARIDEADRLRAQRVQSARYEAELARHRFMQVDPNNRLVAGSLEADWNEKLRTLARAEEEYERRREADRKILDDETRGKIRDLATDFPELWNDPRTPDRDRKRMARLLLEDVTLIKGEETTVHARFRGGATRTLSVPRARASWEEWQTSAEVVRKVDELLDHHTAGEVASILHESGYVSGQGKAFDARRIGRIQRVYGLESRYDRLRNRGLLTAAELAAKHDLNPATVRKWRAKGRLTGFKVDGTGRHLFNDPDLKPAPKSKQRHATATSGAV